MHSRATDRRSASKCQRKGPGSEPRPSVRITRGAGSGQHLASVLQEGRENANIDPGLGFIWRISAQMKQLVKKALRLPAKAILASGYDVIQKYIATSPAVWFNPYLSAKVRPYRPEAETYIIRRDDVARPVTT